jgi:hypothetical protein
LGAEAGWGGEKEEDRDGGEVAAHDHDRKAGEGLRLMVRASIVVRTLWELIAASQTGTFEST